MSSDPTNQIIVRGTCNKAVATFFIDTGSSVSLASRSFVDSLGLSKQIKPTKVLLSSFTADSIKTHGEIMLDIELAKCHVIRHKMIVTDLVDTHCLIGFDFLKNHRMNIDVNRRCITSEDGEAAFLQNPRQLKKTCTVRATKPYVVPANTVMYIKAKAPDLEMDESSYSGFVEPKVNLLLNNGLLVDSALCLTEGKTLPLRVSNLSDSPVTVYKNKVLGTFYPVDNECDQVFRGVKQCTTAPEEMKSVHKITEAKIKEPDSPWTKHRLWDELKIADITGITRDEQNRLKDLVWRYRDCFSTGPFDLGECNMFEGDIQLKPDFKHTWVPARPIPYLLRDKMEEQIRGLEKADVIEKCTEKSLWNSPAFLVKKPHQPDKMRFVVDMRAINAQCLPDNFQMPLIGHVADKVGGHKWYSTFDCSQSFHQIRYNKKSRPITAFTTANGSRYWFKRLIMGHKTSGAQFSRCMSKILYNLPFDQLVYFLDDLLLASDTVDDHLYRLEIVFQRLTAAGMKLSPGKSHFLQHEVNFVGVTLSEKGLRITDERIKTLTELKSPTDRKSLQSLLGFFGFNRKWIPQYASLTHCMFQLLRKGVPFKWTKTCEENLQKLKEAAKNSITLCVPDLHDKEQSYELVVDGSKYGMGAHLSQKINGERRIIGYFSKAVPPHKREWGQTKLELLTLVHAIKFWEPYLKGTHFKVKTDCLSLTRLDTIFAKNNPTLRRKIQALAEHSFDIVHLSGAQNSMADFLSRYPFKKKFKDAATQCSNVKEPTSEKDQIAQVQEDKTEMQQHGEVVDRVSVICDRQNKLKVDHIKRRNAQSDDKTTHHTQSKESAKSEQEMNVISGSTDVSKTSESPISERLIPASFFSQKNRILKPDKVKYSSAEPEEKSCFCNLIEHQVAKYADVNTISDDADNSMGSAPVTLDQSGQSQMPNLSPTISSLAAIKTAQEADPILSLVGQWLRKGEKPETIQAFRAPKELVSYFKQFSLLKLAEGIIVREWIPVNHGDREEKRQLICVPEQNRESVLHMCHNSLMSNHPGTQLTLDIVRRYYYWPGMVDEVTLYVNACTTCGRTKPPQSYSKATRQHIIAHEFNQILAIDHIEPEKLGLTAMKNKYILSMTDVFSGYVVAVATNSQSSEENIKLILHNWALRFGIPREILCDNATGFSSKFYNAVLTALHCKNTHGLPYECRTTSKAERSNKRLNSSLRACLEGKNPKTWDRYLDYICSALNSLRSRATGYSANFLVFGHELNTPLSLLVENGDKDDVFDPAEPGAFDQKAYELHKAYRDVVRKVRRNLQSYYAHADMNFNNGIRNKPFQTGDYCYVLIRCPVHKFAPRWHGPVKIVKAVNDHVYVVKIGNTEKVVNISKLKKYNANKYSPNLSPHATEFIPKQHADQPANKEETPTSTGAELVVSSQDDGDTDIQIFQPEAVDLRSTVTLNQPIADVEVTPTPTGSSNNEQEPNSTDHEPVESAETSLTQRPKRTGKQTVRFQVDPRQKSYSAWM